MPPEKIVAVAHVFIQSTQRVLKWPATGTQVRQTHQSKSNLQGSVLGALNTMYWKTHSNQNYTKLKKNTSNLCNIDPQLHKYKDKATLLLRQYSIQMKIVSPNFLLSSSIPVRALQDRLSVLIVNSSHFMDFFEMFCSQLGLHSWIIKGFEMSKRGSDGEGIAYLSAVPTSEAIFALIVVFLGKFENWVLKYVKGACSQQLAALRLAFLELFDVHLEDSPGLLQVEWLVKET